MLAGRYSRRGEIGSDQISDEVDRPEADVLRRSEPLELLLARHDHGRMGRSHLFGTRIGAIGGPALTSYPANDT